MVPNVAHLKGKKSYISVCVRIIHRCQISTKIAVVESRTSKILKFSNFKKHRCKLRQNAPFSVLGLLKQAVSSQNISVSKNVKRQHLESLLSNISQEYELQKHRFKLRPNEQLSVLVLNSVNMHHLASLFSNICQQFQLPKHHFKQRQKTPFSVLDFIFFLAVSKICLEKIFQKVSQLVCSD